MRHRALVLLILASSCRGAPAQRPTPLGAPRQLTFTGKRAGEAYFGTGDQVVFQSERYGTNPFYQIYSMDLTSGAAERISTGRGKSSCAWIHPDGSRVLYASTHGDPRSAADERAEMEVRAAGKARRYSWDYDEDYELWSQELAASGEPRGEPVLLYPARGYDAEGSWSPDGTRLLFASNRHAYTAALSAEERRRLAEDPSFFIDLYLAEGDTLRRLTDSPGYDGGPFFSADGERIVWRRFTPDGATAEIWSMSADGSGAAPLTKLGAMSWAPFFHPSGDYVVFTTNLHGMDNFELYAVAAASGGAPVRLTDSPGFDGLPAFSPDGRTLLWSSGRGFGGVQIFAADWDDAAARRLLGLPGVAAGRAAPPKRAMEIEPTALEQHVRRLASPDLEGRLTGSRGERRAADYVAAQLARAGLTALGSGWLDPFELTVGVSLGPANSLEATSQAGKQVLELDRDWRPLAFSRPGEVAASEVVFVGYGLAVPEGHGETGYDSYVHADVKDKWVLVLRYYPEEVEDALRQRLREAAPLRHKAMIAREHGARGIIVVSGPRSQVKEQLVPLAADASHSDMGVAALSITDAAAAEWLGRAGLELEKVQSALDRGEMRQATPIPGLAVAARLDLPQEKRTGHNVVGLLRSAHPEAPPLVLGAHLDHLGHGSSDSLARADEVGRVHPGADDNASGVAALIEVARLLSEQARRGELELARDVIFGAWSGEELGLLGSSHFVKARPKEPRAFAAYLNMDMIGRLDRALVVQGVGSSHVWPALLEGAAAPAALPITVQEDSYLPTDATAFYVRGVPILSAFTGAHSEYHTPRDTPDRLDYGGAARIAAIVARVAAALGESAEIPDYVASTAPREGPARGIRAYLGTVPDYSSGATEGVLLSGVQPGSPAEKAGVRGGDVVVELGGRAVANIYDYTYALDGLRIGVASSIVVRRGDERLTLEITPASRQ